MRNQPRDPAVPTILSTEVVNVLQIRRRWLSISSLVLLAVLLGPPVSAAELLPERPLHAGENLHYRIRLGPLTVGEGCLAIDDIIDCDGRPAYVVRYTARSGGVLSRLYPVRDRITSWADTLDFRTHRLQKRIREGRYREACDWRVDHDLGLARERSGDTLSVACGIHDVFSAFLRVRSSRLVPGGNVTVPVLLGGAATDLSVAVGPPRRVRVPAGAFDTIAVQPDLGRGGPFQHDGAVTIDLSRDRRRWPVRIRMRVPIVGAIVVELVDVETARSGSG